MLDKIKQIISEIGSFTATTPAEVEQFRIKHLSKKGTIALYSMISKMYRQIKKKRSEKL